VLRGDLPIEEGVEETIRLTWRMVRRQRAWFGRDDGAIRVDGADPSAAGVVLAALEAAGTGPGSI
jgi:tRNA A37 N6-isopentenylltransferase MiaA